MIYKFRLPINKKQIDLIFSGDRVAFFDSPLQDNVYFECFVLAESEKCAIKKVQEKFIEIATELERAEIILTGDDSGDWLISSIYEQSKTGKIDGMLRNF